MSTEFVPVGPLLPSKLRPPHTFDNLVDRSLLIQRRGLGTTKVTIVVAPAGFGKSTLLAQWVLSRNEPIAWFAVDPEDNGMARFLEYVIAAFASFDPVFAERIRERANTEWDGGDWAYQHALLREVTAYSVPWVLVIDDYHLIRNREIHDFITRLIAAMPTGCRLVIATRTEPPLPTARMRVHGELTLLDADDLRATLEETRLLLRQHDVHAVDAQTVAAMSRVGGWMLGLHLIAHAAKSTSIDDVLGALTTFDEDMELLNEFLLQEVLDQQEPELRTFLLQVSILNRFTSDACFALTRNPSSRLLLDRARRRGLFLIDLDETGTWRRFHHVFVEFLRRQLFVETDPEQIRRLYADASHWHAQNGLTSEAIGLAITAEDWQSAVTLINSAAHELIFMHRLAELFGWVQMLPPTVVLANPNLSTVFAYGLTRAGRASEAFPFLDAAEEIWTAEGFSNGLALIEINRAMAARFIGNWQLLVRGAAKGLAFAPGEHALDDSGRLGDVQPRMYQLVGTWQGRSLQSASYDHLALGLIYLGRINEAQTLVERLVDAWAERGYDLYASVLSANVSMLRLAQGRLDLAEAIARPFAEPNPSDRPTERALSVAVLGDVLYERNQLNEAEGVLRDGLQMLTDAAAVGTSEQLHLMLARVLWAKHDAAGAYAEVDAAGVAAKAISNRYFLMEADALRVRFALADGDRALAMRWAQRRGLSATGELHSATMTEWLTFGRVLIATDDAERALCLFERLRAEAGQEGNIHNLIKVLVVESLAYLDAFQLDHATDVLGEALALGEVGSYQRVFIDEGVPMVRLLRMAHRRGASVQYIRELLETVGEAPEEIRRVGHSELTEPITSRELQVLGLIALGMTNKEIAEELFLSTATIKRHVSNVFGKLGVSNRSEAIHRARKLHLLSDSAQPLRSEPATSAT